MAQLIGFTKTKTIKCITNERIERHMMETINQYRKVVAFYSDLAEKHQSFVDGDWLGAFETLTHQTKTNRNPKFPLTDVVTKYPSGFRRAAITEAVGSCRSWMTRYEQWKTKKDKQEEKNQKRIQEKKKNNSLYRKTTIIRETDE